MIAATRTVPPMEAPAMTAGLGPLLLVLPPVLVGWGVWVSVVAKSGPTTRVVTTGTSTRLVTPSLTTAERLIEVSTVVFEEADLLTVVFREAGLLTVVFREADLLPVPVPPVTMTVGGWVITVPSRVITVPGRVVVLASLGRVCEMDCTKLVESRVGAEGAGAEGDWVLTVLGEGGVLPGVTVLPGPVVVTAGGLAVVEGGRSVVEGGVVPCEPGLTGLFEEG